MDIITEIVVRARFFYWRNLLSKKERQKRCTKMINDFESWFSDNPKLDEEFKQAIIETTKMMWRV